MGSARPSSFGHQASGPVSYSQEHLLSHLQQSAKSQDVSKGNSGRTTLADLTNSSQQRSVGIAGERKPVSQVSQTQQGTGTHQAQHSKQSQSQFVFVPSLPQSVFQDPRLIDGLRHGGDQDRKRKAWVDVDALNRDDPQAVSHYAVQIFDNLREAELKRRPDPDYVRNQQEINSKMRSILVDWLVEVSEEYRMVPDTLYLAVVLLDRVLSIQRVARSQLQLVGITCMWIAAKYEEIYPPNVREFSYITDSTYSKEQMVAMEEEVLKKLNYELTVPTAKTFLRRMLQVCNPDDQLHFLSNYLTEISIMEADMLVFLPSEIAAAGVYLANLILARPPWSPTLEHYSTYSPNQLMECVQALANLHLQVNSRAQGGELTALYEKYSHSKYMSVSRVSPLPHSVVAKHLAMVLGENSASGVSSRA